MNFLGSSHFWEIFFSDPFGSLCKVQNEDQNEKRNNWNNAKLNKHQIIENWKMKTIMKYDLKQKRRYLHKSSTNNLGIVLEHVCVSDFLQWFIILFFFLRFAYK